VTMAMVVHPAPDRSVLCSSLGITHLYVRYTAKTWQCAVNTGFVAVAVVGMAPLYATARSVCPSFRRWLTARGATDLSMRARDSAAVTTH